MRISDWSSDVCSSDLIADLPESQAPRFCVWVATQVGRGCECPWGRNKGGGVGRRPAPGDIRPQGHSQPAPSPTDAARPTRAGDVQEKARAGRGRRRVARSEEHPSELQSLMRLSSPVSYLQTITIT